MKLSDIFRIEEDVVYKIFYLYKTKIKIKNIPKKMQKLVNILQGKFILHWKFLNCIQKFSHSLETAMLAKMLR